VDDTVLVTQWCAHLLTEKRVAPNTYSAYKSDVQHLLVFLSNNSLTLKTVGKKDLKRYLADMQQRGIVPRSVSRKITAVRMFFSYLVDRYDYENVAEDLVLPKLEKRLPHYLTEAEIAALLAASDKDQSPPGKRMQLILYLLYTTGMRISELAHLKLSDIRLQEAVLQFMGKGGKERAIPIPAVVCDMVRHYINNVHHIFLRKTSQTGTEPLFPTLYGEQIKPISRQLLWMIIKDACKMANIQKTVSPHQLRHSLATHLLKNGADLRSIQMMLGHETISTVEIYTHVETSHMRLVYDKKHPRS
jgi:integrase/recombinase XerD